MKSLYIDGNSHFATDLFQDRHPMVADKWSVYAKSLPSEGRTFSIVRPGRTSISKPTEH